MSKIYIAGSWRNEVIIQELAILMRKTGHEVYDFTNPPLQTGFSWNDIDPGWKNWNIDQFKASLFHPIAQAGFDSDFSAMQWADICVLVLPSGRSAHTEAGWFAGQGKRVIVYYSLLMEEPELMYKLYDDLAYTREGLMYLLSEP